MSFNDLNNQDMQTKWKLINSIVALAKEMRLSDGQAIDAFKIERHQLENYLAIIAKRNGLSSVNELLQNAMLSQFENSIIVLNEKTILMDHNSGEGDYNVRYSGQGKFGRVKQGIDENGKLYAIKVERKRERSVSEAERRIMERTGDYFGTIIRETNTTHPWIDNNAIQEKEMTIMSWHEGKPLSQFNKEVLKTKYPTLSELEISQLWDIIALGVIKSINRLNQMGIAHRDINAGNFLMDINHLPSDLSTFDLNAYLEDHHPLHKFSKLVTAIDFGLAIEVPTDGASVRFPDDKVIATTLTPPECLADGKCSMKSDIFSMVLFLNRYFGINTPLDNLVLDTKLSDEISNYVMNLDYMSYMTKKRQDLQTQLEQLDETDVSPRTKATRNAILEAIEDANLNLGFCERDLLKGMNEIKSTRFKPEDRPSLDTYFAHLQRELMKKNTAAKETLSVVPPYPYFPEFLQPITLPPKKPLVPKFSVYVTKEMLRGQSQPLTASSSSSTKKSPSAIASMYITKAMPKPASSIAPSYVTFQGNPGTRLK